LLFGKKHKKSVRQTQRLYMEFEINLVLTRQTIYANACLLVFTPSKCYCCRNNLTLNQQILKNWKS